MTIGTITIRQADIDDVPDLVRLRRTMFESMGYHDPEQLAAVDEAATAYLSTRFRNFALSLSRCDERV